MTVTEPLTFEAAQFVADWLENSAITGTVAHIVRAADNLRHDSRAKATNRVYKNRTLTPMPAQSMREAA